VVAGRVSIMTIAIVLVAILVDAQGSSFEVTVNKVRRKHASKEHLSGHSFLRCRLPGYSVALVYLSLFRQITVYEDRASKTPGGDPDTQDANGSTDLSTRHLRWAEARLPLGAAGASSRTFVPAFCCIIIQVKLKVVVLEHGALVHGGRVVVLSSRCGERYAWRARGRARGG